MAKENRFKSLKAQAEYLVILGMVIVSVSVVLLVNQAGFFRPEPAGIGELKALLKADVERMVLAEAAESIIKIGKQGGYFNSPSSSIDFSETKVPYWGICQNKHMPTLEQISYNIKSELEDRLSKLDAGSLKAKYGKEIKLGQAKKDEMDVVISDQDVDFTIYLPTNIEGFDIQQPYKITVPLGLGRAYDFAANFIENNTKERHFDRFIASLLYHADSKKLPTLDVLSNCGDFIFKTFDQLKGQAQKIFDYSLTNVVLWQKPPPDDQRKFLEYYIPEINGKTYKDLDIRFYRGAELNSGNFKPSQNPVSEINSKQIHNLIGECLKAVIVDYSINVPIVASVKSGSYEFDFAFMPFVDENKIGKCKASADLEQKTDDCQEKNCPANVKVVDADGKPVKGAKIAFGQCAFGVTGKNGIVSGSAPCGVSELSAYHPVYDRFYDVVSASGLDKTVVLKRMPLILFNMSQTNSVLYGCQKSNMFIRQCFKPEYKIYSASSSPIDIVATFKSKDRPWNPFEFIVTNMIGDADSKIAGAGGGSAEPWRDKKSKLGINITQKYSDGNYSSRNETFEVPVDVNADEQRYNMNITVKNANAKNITAVEILVAGGDEVFVKNSNSTTARFAGFSIHVFNESRPDGKRVEVANFSWSNKTTEGFISSGQEANFSAIINLTTDAADQADANVPETAPTIVNPNLVAKLIDYAPPGKYNVEVRAMKKATFSKTICVDYHWFWGCQEYKTIQAEILLTGTTNQDFEIKENDREIHITPLIPGVSVTSSEQSEFNYTNSLGAFNGICGADITPLNRSQNSVNCGPNLYKILYKIL